MDALVSTAWLAEELGATDLRIIDCTFHLTDPGRGRRDWESAHIPTSFFLDLVEFSAPDSTIPFTMLPAAELAGRLSNVGVGDGTRVVVYDAHGSVWAARLWWMLHSLGFDDAAVLDGGWTSWKAEARPTSADAVAYPAVRLCPQPRPGVFVDRQAVLDATSDPDVAIVFALERALYTGERADYGRPGHIPGALNVPAHDIIDHRTQRYRSLPELRQQFEGVVDRAHVITYCGAGIAACSDAFALKVLGHESVSVYDGSLLEWCADAGLPLQCSEHFA